MLRKTIAVLLSVCWVPFHLANGFAQEINYESRSKVGGFKLPDRGFGVFATARHLNKDASFTDYVNYYARFALCVGAVDSNDEILLTSGNGNAITRRPEWAPKRKSFKREFPPSLDVEKVVTLSYWDGVEFEGHKPLGLHVDQKVYGFNDRGFAILYFTLTLDSEYKPVKDLYVGFWGDIDAPDSDGRDSPANDKIVFAANNKAVIIYDSDITGNEIPRLGAMMLSTEDPIVSWWNVEDDPETDEQQYIYLKGEGPKTDPNEPGDVRFLLSYGPLSLSAEDTIHLPIALAQASSIDAFENSLVAAQEFFDQELGGQRLKKKPTDREYTSTATEHLPQNFRLYPNFPNPFVSGTKSSAFSGGNSLTQIRFDLPEPAHVKLWIYNTTGRVVRNLVERHYSAGRFSATWNGRDDSGRPVSSGIYFYKIQAGQFQAQREFLLLK